MGARVGGRRTSWFITGDTVRRIHSVASVGFAADADRYERVRPSYPAEAVEFFLGTALRNRGASSVGDLRVLEVASGTGKLTRCLVDAGCRATACEPVAEMRAAFAKSVPEVTSIDARADALPFPDSTFDLICVGQAFHWFANIASLREMGRVLAPGATLALAWNLEDADYDWVAEIRACYEAYDEGTRGDVPQYRKGVWREAFDEAIDIFPANVDRHFFDHHVLTTRDEIIDRALSKSYIASLPPSDQARVREDLAAILRRREKDALRFETPRPADGAPCALLPIKTEVAIARRSLRADVVN